MRHLEPAIILAVALASGAASTLALAILIGVSL